MKKGMRRALLRLIGLSTVWLASGHATNAEDEVSKGHQVALMVCSYCHVVSADQPNTPILSPPGPSFESIAQRRDITAESLFNFLNTTHRNIDENHGMPNPELIESHAKAVIAYLLSLRK